MKVQLVKMKLFLLTLCGILPLVKGVGIHLYQTNGHCNGGHTACTDVKLGQCCTRGPGAGGDLPRATLKSAKFVNLLESEKGVIFLTDGTNPCAFKLNEVSGGSALCASYGSPATGAAAKSCLDCMKRDLAGVDIENVVPDDVPCNETVEPDKLVLVDGQAFDIGPSTPLHVTKTLYAHLLANSMIDDIPVDLRKHQTSIEAP